MKYQALVIVAALLGSASSQGFGGMMSGFGGQYGGQMAGQLGQHLGGDAGNYTVNYYLNKIIVLRLLQRNLIL